MRFPLRTPVALTALTAGIAAAAIATPAAMAAPATIAWDNGSDTTNSINQGEAVTWDVQGSGHNIDVISGPETFRSTTGKDAVGTQYSHTFSKPGTYKFICDYHSSMKGTITVVAAQTAPAGQPAASGQPAPAGSTAQPTSGAPAAGPAGAASANGAVDAAAPSVSKAAFRRNVLRMRLSEAAKLTVRYVKTGTKAHTVASRKLTAKKGLNTFSVRRWMRPGRYRVSIVAMDAAGNVSKTVRLKLTVRR